MVGQLQWEVIEPLDDDRIYARFLAEKGGGVHHIAVAAQSFDEMLAMEARRGTNVVLSGNSKASGSHTSARTAISA
jgi:methylmalonyl-CoA/ethylmalonyl-CoA epimerase